MNNPIIDPSTYAGLLDSMGAEFMAELVETYLADMPLQIAALRDAFSAGDADTFRRAAHSIKSTSLNFGAVQLADQARSLEYLGRDRRLEAVGDGLDELAESYKLVEDELKRLNDE